MKTLHMVPLILLTAFIFTGCATSKTNGILSRSEKITKIFESATVVPDHTYYFTGPQAQPDAIIAIDNRYTLQQSDKKFWIKVDISEKMLQDWNVIIDTNLQGRIIFFGYGIITPDGHQIGMWYSRFRYTVIKFPDTNTVIIYTPNIDPRKPFMAGPLS